MSPDCLFGLGKKGVATIYVALAKIIIAVLVIITLFTIIVNLLDTFSTESQYAIGQEIIKGEIGHGAALFRVDESISTYSLAFPMSIAKGYAIRVEFDEEEFASSICTYDLAENKRVGDCETIKNVHVTFEAETQDELTSDVSVLQNFYVSMEREGDKQFSATIQLCADTEDCLGGIALAQEREVERNYCQTPPSVSEYKTLLDAELSGESVSLEDKDVSPGEINANVAVESTDVGYFFGSEARDIIVQRYGGQGEDDFVVSFWKETGATSDKAYVLYCKRGSRYYVMEAQVSQQTVEVDEVSPTIDWCETELTLEAAQYYWNERTALSSAYSGSVESLSEWQIVSTQEIPISRSLQFRLESSQGIELTQIGDSKVYYDAAVYESAEDALQYYVVYCEDSSTQIDYYTMRVVE